MAEDETLAQLAKDASALLAKVTALAGDRDDAVTNLGEQTKRNRRMIIGLAVISVVTLLLSFLVAGAITIANSNTEHISQITTRLDESQTLERQKALCPLYSLLVAADTPAAREAAADKALYDKDFSVIREGYSALKCSDFTGGAPTLGSGN